MKAVFIAFLLVSCFCPAPAIGQTPSTDLIERARELDGRQVRFVGEAIGDPMRRGDHYWINVSDGANAIGVWIAASDLPSLRHYGSYQDRGDTILVEGIFHRSCPDHGGDLDIHASVVSIVEPGGATPHPVAGKSAVLAAVLLLSSLVVFILWRRTESRGNS